MARKKPTETQLTAQSVAVAEFAAKALIATEQLGIKTKAVKDFPLEEGERVIAADLPVLSAQIKSKLTEKNVRFSIVETASIVLAVADSLLAGDPLKRLTLLFIAKKLRSGWNHV